MATPSIDQGVNWDAPWLSHLRELGQQVAKSVDWKDALNHLAQQSLLKNSQGLPIRFVPQEQLPKGVAYESHIAATGFVPTRDNLHDFFNALIWLTFPQTKAQLNALQDQQIKHSGIGRSRGPARDAATLFDENAAILAVTDDSQGRALVHDLRQHRWLGVLWENRDQFHKRVSILLFGHALMDKLTNPYEAITSHTVVCWVDPELHKLESIAKHFALDQQVSNCLGSEPLLPEVYSPLPVLGVPGWWPAQDRLFYEDERVFRKKRS